MNHAGTFSLLVVFLSLCPFHLFSPKFSYGHELFLELTLPSVWDGQNESCVRLSLFLLILPGTLSLQLLHFDAEVTCWEVFRLQTDHIFSFTPLPCLSCQLNGYMTTGVCILCCFHCMEHLFRHLNCCAVLFFKCQSSCTSPRFIPQWALKCSKLHITQVSCSERRMTNVPCRMADSQPILIWFQQAQPRQILQPWGIQPYASCTFTGGLHSVIN